MSIKKYMINIISVSVYISLIFVLFGIMVIRIVVGLIVHLGIQQG